MAWKGVKRGGRCGGEREAGGGQRLDGDEGVHGGGMGGGMAGGERRVGVGAEGRGWREEGGG